MPIRPGQAIEQVQSRARIISTFIQNLYRYLWWEVIVPAVYYMREPEKGLTL